MAGTWRRSKRNQYRHPVLIRMADKLARRDLAWQVKTARNNETAWMCLQLVRTAHAGAGSSQGITTSLRELGLAYRFAKKESAPQVPVKRRKGEH